MDATGVVPEDVLTTEITGLVLHQLENPGFTDALVLSLGYYSETPEDVIYTAGLLDLLVSLAENGVTTFAAAGNDSTTRKSYPAAFAIQPPFADENICPLVSVAALNPDRTVALFSNDGPWVLAHDYGANIVSTAPTTIQGGLSAVAAVFDNEQRRTRSTIDPDRYSGGFATWSGTSFAAPTMTGRFLEALSALSETAHTDRRVEIIEALLKEARD